MQSVANQLGNAGLQHQINRFSLGKLMKYYEAFKAITLSVSPKTATDSPQMTMTASTKPMSNVRPKTRSLEATVSSLQSSRGASQNSHGRSLSQADDPGAYELTEVSRPLSQCVNLRVELSNLAARMKALEGLMTSIEHRIRHPSEPKDVELMVRSALAARLMHGARTTSCKSAKDR